MPQLILKPDESVLFVTTSEGNQFIRFYYGTSLVLSMRNNARKTLRGSTGFALIISTHARRYTGSVISVLLSCSARDKLIRRHLPTPQQRFVAVNSRLPSGGGIAAFLRGNRHYIYCRFIAKFRVTTRKL